MAIRLALRGRSAGRHSPRTGPAAFRADPASAPTDRPSSRQATALLTTLVVVAAGIGVASYTVRPDTARTFDLVHGSVFLTDQSGPVGIDFASGKPTLRLIGANYQVGASGVADISLVPVTDGTLMIDKHSGEFNMVDDTGFVIKHDGGGVVLAKRKDSTSAVAVAADGGSEAGVPGAAYVVRTGTSGTDVLLVNRNTVDAASRGEKLVKARAQLTTTAQAVSGQDAVAAANGDLWMLVDSGTQHRIQQLSVPVNSNAGARLMAHPRGTVDGAAAIGTATTNTDGSGGTAVAVAAADRIAYFPADGSAQRIIRLPGTSAATDVLPVSGGQGRFAFLMQRAGAWELITLAGDGTHLRGPLPVRGLLKGASPARPAWSGDQLYTVDRAKDHNGRIYYITAAGLARAVRGAATYPIDRQESGTAAQKPDFSDAYVVSRGSRVLVNSTNHSQAVALFTDDDRKVLVIRKSSAVDVSVAGGAEALTKSRIDPSDERRTTRRGTGKGTTSRQINTKVSCKKTTQTPNIPVFTGATTTATTATLNWDYPTLGDTQACFPTTWRLHARVVSGNPEPRDVYQQINGSPSGTIGGLSPDSVYNVNVTAYLYKQQTTSVQHITVRTLPDDGPSAPTGLRVRPDSRGNWVLDWNGCGSSGNCVRATNWTVSAEVCDALGVAATPAPQTTSASSSRAQGPFTFTGSADLLGRGLRFSIVGTNDEGRPGTPSAAGGCFYSWRAPDAGAITVTASRPVNPTADGTTSVTANVSFAGSAAAALGGVNGTLTYQLLSNGSVVDSVGPTTDTTVRLDNIYAGRSYTVAVSASPPRHPEVSVPVGTALVQPAIAPWPTVAVTAGFTGTSATTGTLTMSFGLGGTSARGEHFDLVNSVLTCGSSTYDLNRTDVTIGERLDYTDVNRFNFNGNCNVTVQLQQNEDNSTDPPLFGAGPSGTTTAAVIIAPPDSTATAADFTAQWRDDSGHPAIAVSYSGNDPETLMSGWQLKVTNGQLGCGSSIGAPPVTIDVPATCITTPGTISVSVDYTYAGTSTPHFDIPVTGTEPQPINSDNVDFTAAWGGDASNPTVNVTYTGTEDKARLSGADWTETVTAQRYPNIVCGSDTKNPGFQVISVPVNLTTAGCPAGEVNGGLVTYQVTVGFTDIYGQDWEKTYDVEGQPPT